MESDWVKSDWAADPIMDLRPHLEWPAPVGWGMSMQEELAVHSGGDCDRAMGRLMRQVAPGSPVSLWFDSSGFITTSFQFVRDDLAAFSGGGPGAGLTYLAVCDIVALRIGREVAGDALAADATAAGAEATAGAAGGGTPDTAA
jgi:hypothetical protein